MEQRWPLSCWHLWTTSPHTLCSVFGFTHLVAVGSERQVKQKVHFRRSTCETHGTSIKEQALGKM